MGCGIFFAQLAQAKLMAMATQGEADRTAALVGSGFIDEYVRISARHRLGGQSDS